MVSMVGSVTILIAMSSTGGIFFHRNPNNHVQPPLPGYGAGYPNGNPDGYGWYDHGVYLPLTADRTPEYYFPRYLSVPATQSFLPNYYNPYVSRGPEIHPVHGLRRPSPGERAAPGVGDGRDASLQGDPQRDAEGHRAPVQRAGGGPAGQPRLERPSPLTDRGSTIVRPGRHLRRGPARLAIPAGRGPSMMLAKFKPGKIRWTPSIVAA